LAHSLAEIRVSLEQHGDVGAVPAHRFLHMLGVLYVQFWTGQEWPPIVKGVRHDGEQDTPDSQNFFSVEPVSG
jgi:hypothetical protein